MIGRPRAATARQSDRQIARSPDRQIPMSLYLGLDCSTQSFTAIVIEVDGDDRRVVFSHALSFDHDFPEYRTTAGVWRGSDPRHVSSSPVMWAAALDRLLGIVATAPEVDPTRIRAISGSAQQHGSVYFAIDGTAALGRLDGSQPLAPQLASVFSRPASPVWMDESTTDQCRAIESALGGAEATVRLTGSRAHERFTGPQIRRFFETEPDAYARTGSIHLVSSYLASLLVGGNAAIDAGDGSGMTLLDLGAGAWSDAALRATAPDLAARLPSLAPSSSAVGTLSTYWQQRHGLPPATVVAWTGDNPSSLVGTGNVRDDGMAISLGTSDTVFALTPDRHSGATHTFAAPMGGYMALVCFRNGSLARERGAIRWVRETRWRRRERGSRPGARDAPRSRWEFICSTDGTWKWRFGAGEEGPFSSLDAATANATSHGFDPFKQSWTSTVDGRTTHYRPGRTPVNLPSGVEPPT
jgi:xylulokinase